MHAVWSRLPASRATCSHPRPRCLPASGPVSACVCVDPAAGKCCDCEHPEVSDDRPATHHSLTFCRSTRRPSISHPPPPCHLSLGPPLHSESASAYCPFDSFEFVDLDRAKAIDLDSQPWRASLSGGFYRPSPLQLHYGPGWDRHRQSSLVVFLAPGDATTSKENRSLASEIEHRFVRKAT